MGLLGNDYTYGPLEATAYSRSVAGAEATRLRDNCRKLMVGNLATNPAYYLLFYVSPTDVGILDLNTIIDQCALIPPERQLILNLGSATGRPTSGYAYYNFKTGGPAGNLTLNFVQIVDGY